MDTRINGEGSSEGSSESEVFSRRNEEKEESAGAGMQEQEGTLKK